MRLHEMSISAIQQALSAGELSAREIARQTLEDIARINPQINAWTAVTEARMLAEAENIDTLRREKRPLPPLAGVPYAVKTCLMWPGTPPSPEPSCSASVPLPAQTALRFASYAAREDCCPGWSIWMPMPTALPRKTATTAPRVIRTI